jgi:mono/diheme cytochrome c family protein
MQRFVVAVSVAGIVAGVGMLQSLHAAEAETTPQADSTELVQRGRYLVTYGGCHDCHTPKVFEGGAPRPDLSRELAGYPADKVLPVVPKDVIGPARWGGLASDDLTAWVGPWGISFAANLTPDEETGLGSWTVDQFKMAMRTGRHKGDGRPILPPMPWYSLAPMTDDDLNAIFAYLQSIPAVKNKVPDPVAPDQVHGPQT